MSAVPDLDTLLAHAGWLERLSLQLCRDEHAAADAVQDTWQAALRSPPRESRNLRGFLATLLRNALRLRVRKETRQRRREADAVRTGFAEAAADAAARAELDRFLTGQVLLLPEPQRGLVLLHYFQGESVATVAERSGLTADAVRAHLRRARQTLRARLRADQGPARKGFALVLLALRPSLLPVALMALKTKLAVSAAALVAVAFLAWQFAWSTTDPRAPGGGAVDPITALQGAAVRAVEKAPPDANQRMPVAEAERSRAIRCQLVGLHADVPWTSPVKIDLEGKDEPRDTWEKQPLQLQPDQGGAFTFVLPAWAEKCVSFEFRFRADDPYYLEFDVHEKSPSLAASPLVAGEVFELPVQVVAVLTGKVVDPNGAPVPAARVCALPWRNGKPGGSPRPETNTAADGSFHLAAPMAADLLVIALPMEEAKLSGMRMTGRNGAIADVGQLRSDLLAASVRASCRFGGVHDVGTVVLPAAAMITGTVREMGRPLAGVGVAFWWTDSEWDINLGDLGQLHAEGRADGRLFVNPGVVAAPRHVTDDQGRFELPAPAGVAGVCLLVKEGSRFDRLVEPRTVSPPANVDFELGPTVVVRVLRGGAQAERAYVNDVAWGQSWPVDAHGEVRMLRDAGTLMRSRPVLGGEPASPLKLQVSLAGEEPITVEVPEDCSPERPLIVNFVPRRRVPVALEVEGDFRVRQILAHLKPLDGTASSITTSKFRNDGEGPFQLEVPPGRYQLVVSAPTKAERRDTFIMTTRQEVLVGPGETSLSMRVRHGSRLAVDVHDGHGLRLGGTVKLIDASGSEIAPAFYSDQDGGQPAGRLPAGSACAMMTNLLPGRYEVVVDLGARGIQRRTVELKACEVAEVKIRVP